MPMIRTSILSKKGGIEAKFPWPDDCSLQGGDDGVVFNRGSLKEAIEDPVTGLVNFVLAMKDDAAAPSHYKTAFVEAFPNTPKTFIRGEGATMEEAEQKAWEKYQRYLACKEHEFEKRGYTNGGGFCKHCNMFKSEAFEPEE